MAWKHWISLAIVLHVSSNQAWLTALESATDVRCIRPTLSLGDCDGDGLLDAYAVYVDGEDRFFRNSGNGSFEDVTLAAGLAGISGTRSARWADYDRDGFLDLYLAADRAERRLFRNRGDGTFVDATRSSGLDALGGELAAAWLDYDGDFYPDLVIRTSEGDHLLHNTRDGWFEHVQLGLPVAFPSSHCYPQRDGAGSPANTPPSIADEDEVRRETDRGTLVDPRLAEAPTEPPQWLAGSSWNPSRLPASGGLNPPIATCLPSVLDQAGGGCIGASSTPELGYLYPLSDEFFVAANGNVGVGTTTPGAKLQVDADTTDVLRAQSSTGNARVVVEGVDEGLIYPSLDNTNKSLTVSGSPINGGWVTVAGASKDIVGTGGGTTTIGAGLPNGDLVINTGSSNRMIVDQDGKVGIGTLDPGYLLHVNGDAGKPGGGSWSNASDARLKKNVADLPGALETLLALRGVTYEYRDPEAIGELDGQRMGMIAQEVERVIPDWVETGADGYKRLVYRGFEALTVEALRELWGMIERQDAEIDALRSRVDSLERQSR